jgi:6-methylsalicylic acid synthase
VLTYPQSPAPQGVAIVGLACRTAGGNDSPSALWDFLLSKGNASGEVPFERWEPWRKRDPRNAKILDNIIRRGYFLDNLKDFDAAFFGISPREAELMDPHQRLALELTIEALENAGINPKSLASSDTAVYMGVDSDDYSRMLMEDLPSIEAWSGIGTAAHGIPNRISYHLDLQGPSTAVDAACASSLISIHLAGQAILNGESTVAICGGVNVICAPGLTHMLQKAGALSPEGVCRSFDDEACGYARGEGGATIILKRLDAAVADGDNILAVLKGTASAQDGKTNGIMAPNSAAQEMVGRQALRRAGINDPHTIGYVEAHATSTALGDPTEISAIAKLYGTGRPQGAPCMIGSIKPNIGHLEAAAGAIGFIKAVLSVKKGQVAPQALLNKLNTRVDWEASGVDVIRETKDWANDGLRRAAICCYGYGGSVCHAIIEEFPANVVNSLEVKHDENVVGKKASPVALVLSAQQEKRLAQHASSLASWLEGSGKTEDLVHIARTLSQRRAAHDHRASFVASDHAEAIRALADFAKGKPNQWANSNRIHSGNTDVVWVYSGHGSQWNAMGIELLQNLVFYTALSELDPIFEQEAGFSVLQALRDGKLGGSDRIQVITYATQVGLTALLKSKGASPQAVVGHSVGEIAASVAAGCLTPREGAMIVSRRAKLYAQVQGKGAMALVSTPFAEVSGELEGRKDIVAAIDCSPSSSVVSGEILAVQNFVAYAENRGTKTWKVQTDIAFHSPMLDVFVDSLRKTLDQELDPQAPNVTAYSTSHADPRSMAPRAVEYWVNNMVAPVKLVDAVNAAFDDGYRVFLEVASHPVISHSISETLQARDEADVCTAFGMMRRDTSANRGIVHALARLHTFGAKIDFSAQLGSSPWCTTVPNTPWVHKPFWKKILEGSASDVQNHDQEAHTLLGGLTEVAGADTKVWTTILDETSKPYPLSHSLNDTEIIPAAVYCNTFHQATGASVLENLELKVPTAMTAEQREVQVVFHEGEVRLLSRLKTTDSVENAVQHSWIIHSSAQVNSANVSALAHTYSIPDLEASTNIQLPKDFAWQYLQSIGVSGIAFPWAVLEHYGDERKMLVRVDMNPDADSLSWNNASWAPFLDAATSIGSSVFYKDIRLRIVSSIDKIMFLSKEAPPKVGYLYIQNTSEGLNLRAEISVLCEKGVLLAKLQGMRFSDVEAVRDRNTGIDALVHRLAWVPPLFNETPLTMDHIMLISEDGQLMEKYATLFRKANQRVTCLSSSNDLREFIADHAPETEGQVVIFLPSIVDEIADVPVKAQSFAWEAASVLKVVSQSVVPPKVFVVTHRFKAATALAHAPLHGFARVAASEYPGTWAGLVECEDEEIPLLALQYVREQSIIRMVGGLPRVPRMRPFQRTQKHCDANRSLLPKPQGTYLVTGGFGDLGREVIEFLICQGARRIVVVSRRPVPARKDWAQVSGSMAVVVEKIQKLEAMGASIHAIALDIGSPSAASDLRVQLDHLNLPPVLGVVHAAGISVDGYIKDTTSEQFEEVMACKVRGALTLDAMFPAGTLDFVVLFSSIGQLLGTPGQVAYASANAFLDALAINRRAQGCNSIAVQWTAWRNMGLARDNDILEMELSSQGVTDVTTEEAFQAWMHLSDYDTDHAVVTRMRILDADEPLPCSLVAEVIQRRAPATPALSMASSVSCASPPTPSSGPEFKAYLSAEIRQCLSAVLHLDAEEIDDRAAITDLGVDSVMTVALRQQLQKAMSVKVRKIPRTNLI